MLHAFTFWSAHYNEVIIIIAETYEDAYSIMKERYLPSCDTNDWIIGGSIPCTKERSTTVNIIK